MEFQCLLEVSCPFLSVSIVKFVPKVPNLRCAKRQAQRMIATSAIAKNQEFGRKLNMTGRPTMFFADGELVPGAIHGQPEKTLKNDTQGNRGSARTSEGLSG